MTRRNFSTRVRIAAVQRAEGRCEKCSAILVPGRWQLDHIIPDGMNGEPVLENAQCLCELCWKDKNPKDTSDIARAVRRQAANLGAKAAPKHPIRSAGFAKSDRRREPKPPLPRPPMFVDIE